MIELQRADYINLTKGQLAEKLYGGFTYDCAVPQDWVNAHSRYNAHIGSQVATVYKKNATHGYILPLTLEAALIILNNDDDIPELLEIWATFGLNFSIYKSE